VRGEARWLAAVALLFAAGIAFSLLTRRAAVIESGPGMFWMERQFDLFLQLGLFFLGTLGIRALLPGEEEEDE
jgi:hypothetical protein